MLGERSAATRRRLTRPRTLHLQTPNALGMRCRSIARNAPSVDVRPYLTGRAQAIARRAPGESLVTKPVDCSRAHSDRRAAELALQPRLGYYRSGGAGLVVLLVLLLMADLTLKRSRGMWTPRTATLAWGQTADCAGICLEVTRVVRCPRLAGTRSGVRPTGTREVYRRPIGGRAG